jgi:hypothetical protein
MDGVCVPSKPNRLLQAAAGNARLRSRPFVSLTTLPPRGGRTRTICSHGRRKEKNTIKRAGATRGESRLLESIGRAFARSQEKQACRLVSRFQNLPEVDGANGRRTDRVARGARDRLDPRRGRVPSAPAQAHLPSRSPSPVAAKAVRMSGSTPGGSPPGMRISGLPIQTTATALVLAMPSSSSDSMHEPTTARPSRATSSA